MTSMDKSHRKSHEWPEPNLASDHDTIGIRSSYPDGWKVIEIKVTGRPKGIREWFNFIWGLDIFVNGVPFMKTLVALNILVWILF